MKNWALFTGIAIIALLLVWDRLRRGTQPTAEARGAAPAWNLIDVLIAFVFVAAFATAYTLQHVLGFSGQSVERALGAAVFGYLIAVILWAAAVAPDRSRLLYQLHGQRAGLMAIVFLVVATGALLFALGVWTTP